MPEQDVLTVLKKRKTDYKPTSRSDNITYRGIKGVLKPLNVSLKDDAESMKFLNMRKK